VLWVAKGAKQAAEQARDLTRLKTLVDELENAKEKVHEIGIFARAQQSEVLWLRAAEVIAICKIAATRWARDLDVDAKNDLLNARSQIHSIAELASQTTPLTEKQWKRISAAQLRSSDLISGVLGSARQKEEKR